MNLITRWLMRTMRKTMMTMMMRRVKTINNLRGSHRIFRRRRVKMNDVFHTNLWRIDSKKSLACCISSRKVVWLSKKTSHSPKLKVANDYRVSCASGIVYFLFGSIIPSYYSGSSTWVSKFKALISDSFKSKS